MRKIGLFLKEERTKKKLSLSQMERDTKIKRKFIDMIEKGEWNHLPEYSVTSGFIRTIAKKLSIPEENAMAVLRRDYPSDVSKLPVNPKPDLKLRTTISPKFIMILLSAFAGILFLGYLVYQYVQYISPPKLLVSKPIEGQEEFVGDIPISGKTDSEVTLTVNNQKVLVSKTGDFNDKINVAESTKEIIFIAKSRYGKETIIIRQINLRQN